jgi:repressor LexA
MDTVRSVLKEHLTPRQIELLGAIAQFQQNHCFSPTIAELAERFKISRSTTFEHIEELRKKGYLSGQPSRARSLVLASKAYKLLRQAANQQTSNSQRQEDAIPLAGRVAAGVPIEAVENKEFLSLNNLFGSSNEIFALEVRGDSMTGEGIDNGDYVICRKCSTADDGQMVVAIVDGENATLKRFYKEKSSVRLQPANERYEPIYSRNCRIEAIVIGVIKKFNKR